MKKYFILSYTRKIRMTDFQKSVDLQKSTDFQNVVENIGDMRIAYRIVFKSPNENTNLFLNMFQIFPPTSNNIIINNDIIKLLPETITIMDNITNLREVFIYNNQFEYRTFILEIQEKIDYNIYLQIPRQFILRADVCNLLFTHKRVSIDNPPIVFSLEPKVDVKITKKIQDMLTRMRDSLVPVELRYTIQRIENMMKSIITKK